MSRCKKGFTLIELLAVIVILAIIALIATPAVFGIINKARKASFIRSAENMVKASNIFYLDAEIQKIKGNTRFECVDRKCISSKMDKYGSPLQLETEGDMGEGYVLVTNDGDIEFQLEKGNWCATKYMNKDKIFVYDNKCGEIINDYEKPVIDRVNYTKTTKSITIVVNAYADSGISYYEYSIDGGKTYTEKQENNTYTFNNLKNDKEYEIRVRVYNGTYGKDNYDEETGMNESEIIKVSLNQLPTPIITITNETTWEQRKEVTIDYGNIEGTIGSYSIDGGDTWVQGNNLIVEENNTPIIAKTTDGKNTVTISHLVTHIDNNPPTLTLGISTATDKTISIPLTENSDAESGIKTTTCVAGLSTSNYNITGTISNNTCTISGLDESTTYYYKVTATDNALNSTEKTGNMTTLASISGTPTITASWPSTSQITTSISGVTADGDTVMYRYSIGGTVKQDWTTSNTYTFTGLSQGTSYSIKVETKAQNSGALGNTKTATIYTSKTVTKSSETGLSSCSPSSTSVGGDDVYDSILLTSKCDGKSELVWTSGTVYGPTIQCGTLYCDGSFCVADCPSVSWTANGPNGTQYLSAGTSKLYQGSCNKGYNENGMYKYCSNTAPTVSASTQGQVQTQRTVYTRVYSSGTAYPKQTTY